MMLATVTQLSPLMVQVDGAATAAPAMTLTPTTFTVGARVLLELVGSTLIVVEGAPYLAATGKAVDSDKLDGLDSTAFAKLAGAAFTGEVSAPEVWVSYNGTGTTPPASFPDGYSTTTFSSTDTGSPNSSFTYFVITLKHGGLSVMQWAIERDGTPEGDEPLFWRFGYSGGTPEWGAWQRVVRDGDTLGKGLTITGQNAPGAAYTGSSQRIATTNPTIEFDDTDNTGAGGKYWLHHNSGLFYLLQDRDGAGTWDSPHPWFVDAAGQLRLGFEPTQTNSAATKNYVDTKKAPDADLLDGYNASIATAASTAVVRDSAGDIFARLLRSEYDTTNASIGFIMTQVDTASNNYVRPSTPTQVANVLPGRGAMAHRTNAQGIAHNTLTTVSMEAEAFDSGGYWVSTAPSRLTVPAGLGGVYVIVAHIRITGNTAGLYRQTRISKNGTLIEQVNGYPNGGYSSTYATVITRLLAGDYIEMQGYQDSGVSLSITGGVHAGGLSLARIGA